MPEIEEFNSRKLSVQRLVQICKEPHFGGILLETAIELQKTDLKVGQILEKAAVLITMQESRRDFLNSRAKLIKKEGDI